MTPPPRRRVGLVSLGVGLAAAGAGAALGLAAERVAMGRPLVPGTRPHPPGERLGSLRGPAQIVRTSDGVDLHVEVDASDSGAGGPGAGAEPTIVLSHGYALSMDSWHYQRKALRGRHRLVLWDQRGHGRSGPAPEGSATIDRVGADLEAVIEQVAPSGPLLLVGHSMGGMTVMSLAERRPDLFADRVLGVALVSTSAAGLGDVDLGLPTIGRLVQRLAPPVARALLRTPLIVERGRRLGSDLESVLVRRYSYASDVSPDLVRFTAGMIAQTRLEVLSQFLPTFTAHDKREALAVLDGREVLVLVGDSDLLTPPEHSEAIVRLLPGAEHVVVPAGGHLVMLEHPEAVTRHVDGLVERALRARNPRGGPGRRRGRGGRTVTPGRRRGSRPDGEA
jgi:pimeloyl-ACP methyl ester carboxylesterase